MGLQGLEFGAPGGRKGAGKGCRVYGVYGD